LLPRRWVVDRGFAWLAGFSLLTRDCEPLEETLAGLHSVVFVILLMHRFVGLMVQSSK
jgi:hypothetical protein